MSIKQWIIGAATALSVTPVSAALPEPNSNQLCSTSKFWAESDERAILDAPAEDTAPYNRYDAAYKQFMDTFWAKIDLQINTKAPQTVGDVFGDIQIAFVAASKTIGQAITAFGVPPRLKLDYLSLSGASERAFTATDLERSKIVENPVVSRIIDSGDKNGTFNVAVQFFVDQGNYLLFTVLNNVKSNLSATSPVSQISPAPRNDSWAANPLQKALTCTAK